MTRWFPVVSGSQVLTVPPCPHRLHGAVAVGPHPAQRALPVAESRSAEGLSPGPAPEPWAFNPSSEVLRGASRCLGTNYLPKGCLFNPFGNSEALTCVCATQAPNPAVSSSPWTSTSWAPPQPAGIQAIWEPAVHSLTLAFRPLLFPLKVRVVSFA